MLKQLYLSQVLVRKAGKWSGSCCVPGGPECWGPLRREQADSVMKRLKCQRSKVDSFMLTLVSLAGLSVAALHCGGHGLAAALLHGEQVPPSVRADHLPVSRAGSAAARTLREHVQRSVTFHQPPRRRPGVPETSPSPRLQRATSSEQGRPPFHSAGQRVDAADCCRRTRLFSFLLSQHKSLLWSAALSHR